MKRVQALPLPSYSRVRHLFNYDPDTGVLSWRVSINPAAPVGARAGNKPREDGRRIVRIDGQLYRVSRIIWLWMTGFPPEDQVDHRDTDAGNDSWGNLRAAGFLENAANRTGYAKSGIKGAYFNEQVGRWYSRIRKGGVNYSLGYFDTAAEANSAYGRKAIELFGEFARAA